MKKMKWFGYMDKENNVYVSLYSYWDYQLLKLSNYYSYLIEPFEAPNYEDAKVIAEKKANDILYEELQKIKEI